MAAWSGRRKLIVGALVLFALWIAFNIVFASVTLG
jgi:uncharacterized membrane protein